MKSLRDAFGGPAYRKLFAAVRRRIEESGAESARSVTLDGLTAVEEKALADLHGWTTLPGESVRISIPALDAALRSSRFAAGIVEVLEALDGPLVDRRAHRDLEQQKAAQFWQQASSHGVVAARPALGRWLEELREHGLLTRSARSAGTSEQAMLDLALQIVDRLPAERAHLPVFAADLTGDTHALDHGRPLANLVLRAAANLVGWPEAPASAALRRRLWAEVGVLCDSLSTDVLVSGLRPHGKTLVARHLCEAADAGEARRVTLREIAGAGFEVRRGTDIFICENPGIVATAADRLGARSAPLVCVEGVPSTAATDLLRQLAACGARLRFHADFDWAGIRIGNLLASQLGAQPWRFDSAAYQAAIADTAEAVPLGGIAVPASWDVDLDGAMGASGRAVFEEQVLEPLLADLGG